MAEIDVAAPRSARKVWLERAFTVGAGAFLVWMLFTQLYVPTPSGPRPFQWVPYEVALDRAEAENKLVMIDFFAEWCGPCKKMDAVTFHDARVAESIDAAYVPVQVDCESGRKGPGGLSGVELADRYDIKSYPTIVIARADGTVVERMSGYRGPGSYRRKLDKIAKKHGVGAQ